MKSSELDLFQKLLREWSYQIHVAAVSSLPLAEHFGVFCQRLWDL